MNREHPVKDDWMVVYLKIVMTWKAKFSSCDFKQIPRSENSHANSQATLASAVDFQFRREIPVEHTPSQAFTRPTRKSFV